jgi:hypothetical protein
MKCSSMVACLMLGCLTPASQTATTPRATGLVVYYDAANRNGELLREVVVVGSELRARGLTPVGMVGTTFAATSPAGAPVGARIVHAGVRADEWSFQVLVDGVPLCGDRLAAAQPLTDAAFTFTCRPAS